MSTLARVTCKIPGSTSNCGSGFDTLGLALSIYNYVTVECVESPENPSFEDDIYPGSEMAQATVRHFFEESRLQPFAIRVRITGDVPRARGLGSSVTVRGGILGALSVLAGAEWNKEKLVETVTELEGHPDNASAAILGGFTVSRFLDNPAKVDSVAQFDVGEELRFVVVSPNFEVLTLDSRNHLPAQLAFSATVASINSAACVVAALSSGQYEALAGSVHDHIHEPYRLKNIPGAAAAIKAGIGAGAYTGWLSGSGSSVLCACSVDTAVAAASAMQAAFADAGLASQASDLCADNQGLQVEARE